MLQCGQSQALDEGSVVLAGDSSQCAAGQPVLPKSLLLELLSLKTWHVFFMEQQGSFQVVILTPSAFLKAFPFTCSLSLQQFSLFLNRNTVDQTNLFISAYFFSCVDSDIRFPLQFTSGSHLDSVRCWVLLPLSETGSGSSARQPEGIQVSTELELFGMCFWSGWHPMSDQVCTQDLERRVELSQGRLSSAWDVSLISISLMKTPQKKCADLKLFSCTVGFLFICSMCSFPWKSNAWQITIYPMFEFLLFPSW